MRKLFRKSNNIEEHKAVFSVRVDFNYEYRERIRKIDKVRKIDEDEQLRPGGRYYFESNDENKIGVKATYENIRDFVSNVLVGDLANVCNQYLDVPLDVPVKIQVTGNYDGSLVLVFSAIFNTVQFISGVKDIYDIAQLIRDLAEERIEKRLDKEYGNYFKVNVKQRLPRDSREDYYNLERMMEKGRLPLVFSTQSKNKCGAFFWYLLVSNIVLVSVIMLLVFKALQKVYW
ncbi:MAG: hypothetical protein FWH27_16035 [Planctomycetaceae bacterium]|nr:hypothetical protein [Planctomycetaceae bacterium]